MRSLAVTRFPRGMRSLAVTRFPRGVRSLAVTRFPRGMRSLAVRLTAERATKPLEMSALFPEKRFERHHLALRRKRRRTRVK